jgi:hypothetical protein
MSTHRAPLHRHGRARIHHSFRGGREPARKLRATASREAAARALLAINRMEREQVAQLAERLRRAEAEYQAAQRDHDGSDRATERYRAACNELLVCDRIARAVLTT